MWELDYKESWALKNWWFWTVVLEKTLESPLDCTEIQPVHPKGNQSWLFIGRTDVEAETPMLLPPDVKNWLIWKDPDSGKDWRQENGKTEDEMVHWVDNGPTQWTWVWVNSRSWWWTGRPPWGCKVLHMTERLNWTEAKGVTGLWSNKTLFITTATLVQDGGIEGCGLISSCKSTKIAASYWTTTNRRMLEPTRKRYPTSKDKEGAARW